MVETEPGIAVLEAPATEPEAPIEEPKAAPPEIDWTAEGPRLKAETDRLTKAMTDLEQRAKTAEDRLRAGQSPQDLADLRAEVRGYRRETLLAKYQADQDLAPEERQARIATVNAESEKDAAEAARNAAWAEVRVHAEGVAQDITEKLGIAEIPLDHPKVKEALEKWGQAASRQDFDAVRKQIDRFILTDLRERGAAQTQAERQRANRENETLAQGGGGRGSGGRAATRENIDALFMKWETDHPDEENNPYATQYRKFLRTDEL